MRVLLVEDEVRIADFITRGLSEQGYAVDAASDGSEALQWADVADFDLIPHFPDQPRGCVVIR